MKYAKDVVPFVPSRMSPRIGHAMYPLSDLGATECPGQNQHIEAF